MRGVGLEQGAHSANMTDVESKGTFDMRKALLIVLIGISLSACARPSESTPTSSAITSEPLPAVQAGQFMIVQRTQSDPHTILLDTNTGQTWLLTTPANGSAAWVQIYRPPAAQTSN